MMELEFTLCERDVEESLRCMHWRVERRRTVHVVVLSLISAGCLVAYGVHPDNLVMFLLALLSVGSMFALLYMPIYRRRKKARRLLAGSNGRCRLSLPLGKIDDAVESDDLFTVMVQGKLLCIPKRALNDQQYEAVAQCLRQGGGE